MKTSIVFFALAALMNTVSAQTARPIDAGIIAANKVFMQAFAAGATSMGDLYSTDAQLFPPGGAVVNGNTAIGPVWKGAFDSGVKKATLETTTTEKAGDRIIETGEYTLAGADGTTLDKGKYIVIWKKEGGNWKLYRDIWNTSMAAK
jgi:ketosteroid isomerase-like protein